MGTAAGMIAAARKSIGLGESPSNTNYITRWYGMNGQPWCDMAVTYWAHHSDNATAVCPNGPYSSKNAYAYTVYHAGAFNRLGRFHYGTSGIRAGDIIFYNWGGTRSISLIDHVGVVEYVSGGVIHTIEGNRSDRCGRFIADHRFVVGYGRPAYSGAKKSKTAKKPATPAAPTHKDEMKPISLERNAGQVVEAGKPAWVWWDHENDDSGKQHSAGKPGIVTDASAVMLNGVVAGVEGKCYFVAKNMKTKKERMLDTAVHRIGEVCNATGAVYAHEHVYLKVVPAAAGTVTGWVRGLYQ